MILSLLIRYPSPKHPFWIGLCQFWWERGHPARLSLHQRWTCSKMHQGIKKGSVLRLSQAFLSHLCCWRRIIQVFWQRLSSDGELCNGTVEKVILGRHPNSWGLKFHYLDINSARIRSYLAITSWWFLRRFLTKAAEAEVALFNVCVFLFQFIERTLNWWHWLGPN